MASEITDYQPSSFDIQLHSDEDTAISQQASQAFFSHQTVPNMPNMRPLSNRPKRMLGEEEWETLRPVIQLHYIDENKTLVEVVRILKQTTGFEPTKKQFTTRTKNWGMKKNTSQSERRKFLRDENQRQDLGITDQRLSPAKVANWRKRYKYETGRASGSANQQSNFATQLTRKLIETIELNEEPFSKSTAIEAIIESPVLENIAPIDIFGCEAIDTDMLDVQNQDPVLMEINKWPFDWASVNITGPTGLMELFRGLEIDCANSVPQPISDAQNPEELMCISNSEFQSLWNPHNHSKVSDMYNTSDSLKKYLARRVPQHLKRSFPKYSSVTVIGYTESPCNELYAFPNSHRIKTARPANPGVTLWVELEAQELDLQNKLRILKKQSLPVYHPGIIATTEELANVCFRVDKYKKAETLYRQVVSIKLKAPGTPPLEILASCMGVADALRNMDRYRQAQTLLRKIMGALQKLVNPDHKLAINALHKMGLAAMALEDYEQAEHLFSQVLQIKLSKWGPRHLDSWKSIRDLSYLLTRMRRIFEGEKLLRTSLQLFAEIEGVEEMDFCIALDDLPCSLYCQQSYEESASLARQALERSERSLGPLHQTTLYAQYSLASSLLGMGRLSDSEELFQRTYRQHSKISGCKDLFTVDVAYGLAIVVQKLGRMEEAIELYKEVFRARVNVLGPTHSSTKNSCAVLGRCYEDQGFYEDAIELYTEFVEKLRKEEGGEAPEVMDYESWIEWNRERIQERDEGKSGEDDMTREHDKMEEGDESQEESESNEDDYHSGEEVGDVEEGEDVEESEEIVGAEGICFEEEKLSEEELWSFITL